MNNLYYLLKWGDQQITVRAKFTSLLKSLAQANVENSQRLYCNDFSKKTGLEIDWTSFQQKTQIKNSIVLKNISQRLVDIQNVQDNIGNQEAPNLQEPVNVDTLGADLEETA